jgi:two-component system NtrC family sensor kinase
MIMDVTEQRRAEKVVNESETFLSSIFEGIQDGVVVLDKDFLILFANSSYIEQIGRSSNEIKCKHCYEVSYNRDEPCYLAGLECSVKNVFETGLSSREVRKKDGNYMEIIVYPLKDSSGKVISVVEIRRDVTRNMQLNEEVKIRVRELEEFYDMAVGRELKMVELKEDVERLKEELRKYKT